MIFFGQRPWQNLSKWQEKSSRLQRFLFLKKALLAGMVLVLASANPAQAQRIKYPLNNIEQQQINQVFHKYRPATIRLEDCLTNRCTRPLSGGTGFFINSKGLALTAYHVVKGTKLLKAQTLNKKRYSVRIIGFDEHHDVALIQVQIPNRTPYIPLARNIPRVGQATLAIGNGGKKFLQPKFGRLTALDVAAEQADFPSGTIEMNVPVIPGDSGGPILNTRGEAVGVVSYVSVEYNEVTREQSHRGYAIPVRRNDRRLQALSRGLKREAAMIGISMTNKLSSLFNLQPSFFENETSKLGMQLGNIPGAFFTGVVPGSPAARAGLRPLKYDRMGRRVDGDIVVAVNNIRIYNFSDFQFAVRRYEPGQAIILSVLRNRRTVKLKLVLAPSSSINFNQAP